MSLGGIRLVQFIENNHYLSFFSHYQSSTSIKSYSISCAVAGIIFLLFLFFICGFSFSHSKPNVLSDSTCIEAFSLCTMLRSLTMARTSDL